MRSVPNTSLLCAAGDNGWACRLHKERSRHHTLSDLTQVSWSLSLSLCRRVSHAAIYSQCHLCVPAPPRPTVQTPAAHVPSRERWLWTWIRAGGKVVWRLFGSIRVLPVNTCPVVWQQWHSAAVTVVVP